MTIRLGMLFLALALSACTSNPSRTIGWGEFLHNASQGQVAKVTQQDTKLIVTATDGSTYTVIGPGIPGVNADYLADIQAAATAGRTSFDAANYTVTAPSDYSWAGVLLAAVIPWLLIGLIVFVAVRLALRGASRSSRRDPTSRLRELDTAKTAGLISEAEYATKRAEILGGM